MNPQLYRFVAKVTSAQTKDGSFNAYCFDTSKEGTYKLHVGSGVEKFDVWIGEVINCLIEVIDNSNLRIMSKPITQVACDEGSFVHIIMRALSSFKPPAWTAFKCKKLYDALEKKYCTKDGCPTPYSALSKLARYFVLERADELNPATMKLLQLRHI